MPLSPYPVRIGRLAGNQSGAVQPVYAPRDTHCLPGLAAYASRCYQRWGATLAVIPRDRYSFSHSELETERRRRFLPLLESRGIRAEDLMKLIIALLSIAAVVLLGLAFVQYGPAFAAQAQVCQPLINSNSPQATGCLTSGSQAATTGLVLFLAGIATALLAWLLGLVKTAHIRRWFWFVVVFLLSPLGSLLYGILGPSSRPHASLRGVVEG